MKRGNDMKTFIPVLPRMIQTYAEQELSNIGRNSWQVYMPIHEDTASYSLVLAYFSKPKKEPAVD